MDSSIENIITGNRKWTMIISCYRITEETFDNFVQINENVAVSSIMTDDGITDSVRRTGNVNVVEEESSEPVPRV